MNFIFNKPHVPEDRNTIITCAKTYYGIYHIQLKDGNLYKTDFFFASFSFL